MYLQSNIDKLKARKKELGLTNQQLSKESGVPVGTVNKIFSGATRYPRQETMDAIVKAMKLDYYKIEDYGAGVHIIREASNYRVAREETRATLKDYYELPPDTRAELIDGEIIYMSAPSANHQLLIGELGAIIRNYLGDSNSRCRFFPAPFDVQLDMDEFTMLQPDLMIICDANKYENGAHCYGAPDFVIEITSKSDPRHDYFLKLQKYQNAGVKEYWIVDPIRRRVSVFVFDIDTLPTIYTFEDKIQSSTFAGLEVDFDRIEKMLVRNP